MMHKLLCILVLGTFSAPGGAQIKPRWDTVLFSGGNQPELLVLDISYVSMVQSNTHWNRLQIWETDFNGQVMDTHEITFPVTIENCGSCLERISGNRFIYGHTLFYQMDSSNIQLVKFDRSWAVTDTFDYLFQDTLDTKAFGLKAIGDKFLITGYVYPESNRYHLLLACLDTNFNLLWEKKYQRNNQIGGFWGFDIEPTADGGYLIGGLNTTFPEWNTVNKGMLLKTDSLGNEQWRKTLNYPGSYDGGALRLSTRSDGSFLFAGIQDVAGGMERLRLGAVDVSGNILRDTLIGPAIEGFGTQSIVKTPDGNFIIGGTTQQGGWQAMLFKFSENGDKLWHRYYYRGDRADASSLYNYKVTPDSGLIMAGTYYDVFNNPTNKAIFHWLKKVDQYGCEVANCHNVGTGEHELPAVEAEVYPNPSTGRFFVRLAPGMDLTQEEMFLHDAAGKSTEYKRINRGNGLYEVDISSSPEGVYFLHLSGEMRGHPALKLIKK